MSWWKKTLKWVGLGLEVAGEVKGGVIGEVLDKSGEKLAKEMKESDERDGEKQSSSAGVERPTLPEK